MTTPDTNPSAVPTLTAVPSEAGASSPAAAATTLKDFVGEDGSQDTPAHAQGSGGFSSTAFVGVDRDAGSPMAFDEYVSSLIESKYSAGGRASRSANRKSGDPSWPQQSASAWAKAQAPLEPGKPVVLSCCDELLGLQLAHALLDATDVRVLEPLTAQTLDQWLADRLVTLRGFTIVNSGVSGVLDTHWSSTPVMPHESADARVVVVCEHTSGDGRYWHEGLAAFDAAAAGSLRVIVVDDSKILHDVFERSALFGTANELRLRSTWEQLQQQVDAGHWRFRDKARGWKAVLWFARLGSDEFNLQFKRVTETAAAQESGEERALRDKLDNKAKSWLQADDPRITQVVILASYFGSLSAGAFVDLCTAVCSPLPMPRLSWRRRKVPERINDKLFEQCGLRYESLVGGAVVVAWDDDQAYAVERAIERHAVLARSEVLDRLSRLGVAGHLDPELRKNYLRMLGDVCAVDRGDVRRLAHRLRDLVAPQTASPVSGDGDRQDVALPDFIEVYAQLLPSMGIAAQSRPGRLLLEGVIAELWRASAGTSAEGQTVRPAIRVIADIYCSDRHQDVDVFVPPARTDDFRAKAAEFLHELFESSFFGSKERDPMHRAAALRRAVLLARQGILTESSSSAPDGHQYEFICALFTRLLTWALLKGIASGADDRDDAAMAQQVWAVPAEVGDVLMAALVRAIASTTAGEMVGERLMRSNSNLAAAWRFTRFHAVAETLSDATALGKYRDAYLGIALVQATKLQGIRGSVLLYKPWFWDHGLRGDFEDDSLRESVDKLDAQLEAVAELLPMLLLRQLLNMLVTKEEPDAWERKVPTIKAAFSGDTDGLQRFVKATERTAAVVERFQVACQAKLGEVPTSQAAKTRVSDRIVASGTGLRDLAILVRRLQ